MEKYSSQTHKEKYAKHHCITKGKNLSKLKYIFTHEQEMMKEKYMSKLSRSEASAIFKLRTRMIHLKNNFRNIYEHDILCSRCKKEQDMEEHLFGKCEKLKDLYVKYNILGYEEVFTNNITIERLKEIVKCMCVCVHVYICVCVYIFI